MILAIDGGLATLGWAVVEPRTGRVFDLGFSSTKPADDNVQRDRLIRERIQADRIVALIRQHGITYIAGEGLSWMGRPPIAMVAAACLSWGALVGICAALDIRSIDVPPKTWQHAVLNVGSKVDYEELFGLLEVYLEVTSPIAYRKLTAIAKSNREHPADAVGVGVYAAMRLHPGSVNLQQGASA